jgi:hypothetical protein
MNDGACSETGFRSSTTGGDGLSRREFLALTGMTAATIAMSNHAFGEKSPIGERRGTAIADPSRLAGTHDLISLPHWGPYSKKFFGISHIPEVTQGLSFDLSLFPSLANRAVKLPSVTDHCGVHPWEASTDLDFYSFRLETIWKDQLYCDLAFCNLDSHSRLIRMEFANETGSSQEMAVNCLAQLCFPPLRELTAQPVQLCELDLPPGAIWVHALDYADLTFARPRPTDNLVPEGKLRGEARLQKCVGGSAVAERFGHDAGDALKYRVSLEHPFTNAALIWRFSADRGESVGFQLRGTAQQNIHFRGTGEFNIVSVPLGTLGVGIHDLHFISLGGTSSLVMNGFVIAETEQADRVHFPEKSWNPAPKIERVGESEILLNYRDVSNWYGLSFDASWTLHRLLKWRDLDATFQNESSAYTKTRIFGDGPGRPGDPDSLFVHAASRPFTLASHAKHVFYGILCTGTEAEVRKSLISFAPRSPRNEAVYNSARKKAFRFLSSQSGEAFVFSQQRMAAVTLTNLVYPLYTQRQTIRHFSPGKIWDCLYTWDAGFIGMGLLELDALRAREVLNAYTTPEGAQSAFINHGTPLPTQLYLYQELWNRTQSKETLAFFYPRLRQYHRFLAGRLGSSTTRRRQDGLIVTWDYFYNSGGWDDYPPQVYVHKENLTPVATPVVNSAHTIRCAKLLRQAAQALGRTEDCLEYESDITELSNSLQQYSWDEGSGYFGYVMHDSSGKPSGILRTEGGVNFNMGLDGVSPLIAGICSSAQTQRIIDHLFSETHLWTQIGITTVDQAAPYFNPDGYWNGSVWFAHQWFLWKTMLDLGRGDLALRIAQAGLEAWKQVTDATYDCMEHFMPRPPFGAGWIQFSSLSSPALSWFSALHTPGRFTCGFDTWVERCQFSNGNQELHAKLRRTTSGSVDDPVVLACMNPASNYTVKWNGTAIPAARPFDGLLQIQIPQSPASGELSISSNRT